MGVGKNIVVSNRQGDGERSGPRIRKYGILDSAVDDGIAVEIPLPCRNGPVVRRLVSELHGFAGRRIHRCERKVGRGRANFNDRHQQIGGIGQNVGIRDRQGDQERAA